MGGSKRSPIRPLVGWFALPAAALLLVVPAAISKPVDRGGAVKAYKRVKANKKVGAGWSGSVSGCRLGKESRRSLAATRETVNVIRDFAGLRPVSFNRKKNRKALAAALMMRAENNISHAPSPSWACYSSAARKASRRSNLHLGGSGADAILSYTEDRNISTLAHRRWILDPGATRFGSGSTGKTNALMVVTPTSKRAPVGARKTVSWPAPGWFPWPWVPEDWSMTIGNDSARVSISNPRVSVSVDGRPARVKKVRQLQWGWGTGQGLKWRVVLPKGAKRSDRRIDVSISGVRVNGSPEPIAYSIDAFRPGKRR